MATELTPMAPLVVFAADQQRQHDKKTTPEDRKRNGHFGTPAVIAAFMASLFRRIPGQRVRILDPGAGVGMLTAALCERIAALAKPRHVILEAWENDPALQKYLDRTLQECRRVLLSRGHAFDFTTMWGDFLLARSPEPSLFDVAASDRFDLVIMNPPYFKLRKTSEAAKAMHHVVHGQPNIYALFMAASTDLLAPNGELVTITPRSYFNGPYFRRFRRWFFRRISPRQIHLFDSRRDAFRADDVLQENVILHGEKSEERSDVVITSSPGRDPRACSSKLSIPFSLMLKEPSDQCIVRVPKTPGEKQLLEAVENLPCSLRSLGLQISTGPVVSFRSTQFLLHERTADSAPLLWMHHVRPFVTRFARTQKKPCHIRVCDESRNLLLPAKRYILLKRFTAKEEKRRLVAGIMQPRDSYSDFVGLENHLNYVYRPRDDLGEDEAFGLAAILNSTFIDRYFRAISGNTQVNAAEIRALPLPSAQQLVELGRSIRDFETLEDMTVDRLVWRHLMASVAFAEADDDEA